MKTVIYDLIKSIATFIAIIIFILSLPHMSPTVNNDTSPQLLVVCFFLDTTSLYEEQQVAFKGAAIKPEDPVREGYIFLGWDTDYSMIIEDTFIYALFSKIPMRNLT